jgi:hexosaminidase
MSWRRPEAVVICAVAPAGLFYGIQTHRQLLPPAVFSRQKVDGVQWSVPCVRITDHPRFAWRGLLIDPARHFIPVPDVEQYLDTMALHSSTVRYITTTRAGASRSRSTRN